jgi:flagellar motility protein MotE (MotC chaperone)
MSFKIRPLTGLALALGLAGAVQVGRVALDATNALAQGEVPKEEAKSAAPTAGAAPAAPGQKVGPPMCLPVDLAKEAGISAAEFRLLQALQERRQALDTREREIVTRENLLVNTDAKIQEKMASLKEVEAGLQKLLGQVDELEAQRIAGLVRVYEKMKPKDAAAVWEGLDIEVLLKIAQKMKEQSLSLILAKVSPERAREVTRRLAELDVPTLPLAASTAPPALPAAAPLPPPTAAATKAPPATAPGQQAAASPQTKAGGAPAAAGASPPAAKAQTPAGAGPTAPRAPVTKAPNAPTTPQPAAKAAAGQAPGAPK